MENKVFSLCKDNDYFFIWLYEVTGFHKISNSHTCEAQSFWF
ncbi:hypothetical protein C789_1328 [Microcystis aeruginosa FACHB-905 = DIANCHI905]|nr:hypothetical protein C789_1328 [Microcystis aeruginosa FACHB-905 = DIANCHI905]